MTRVTCSTCACGAFISHWVSQKAHFLAFSVFSLSALVFFPVQTLGKSSCHAESGKKCAPNKPTIKCLHFDVFARMPCFRSTFEILHSWELDGVLPRELSAHGFENVAACRYFAQEQKQNTVICSDKQFLNSNSKSLKKPTSVSFFEQQWGFCGENCVSKDRKQIVFFNVDPKLIENSARGNPWALMEDKNAHSIAKTNLMAECALHVPRGAIPHCR